MILIKDKTVAELNEKISELKKENYRMKKELEMSANNNMLIAKREKELKEEIEKTKELQMEYRKLVKDVYKIRNRYEKHCKF